MVKKLKIKNIRGVFMTDELPKKVHKVECRIINLEDSSKEGSHCTAYFKHNDKNTILILMETPLLQKALLNT